jgi:hypothetical protein
MQHRSVILFVALLSILSIGAESPDLFVGPFAHWLDVQTLFGAKGDGSADDWQAIQNALDSVGRTDGVNNGLPNGGYRVLYFPAGNYKISQTLEIKRSRNFRIVGAHPDSVTITWAGAAGADMFCITSCTSVRVGRITWDGSGAANRIIWERWLGNYSDGYEYFPSGGEHHDQRFLNAHIGIQGGGTDGSFSPYQSTWCEGSIVRCTFKNCGRGYTSQDWNTGDIWIHHCVFEDCSTGVDNACGQTGTYNCIFRRSKVTDVYQGTFGIAVRHCYSIDSKAFYTANGGGDGYGVILDGNTIIDPIGETPISTNGNPGPHVMFDNVIRSTTVPMILLGCDTYIGKPVDHDFLIGNTFTSGTPETVVGVKNNSAGFKAEILDNRIVDPSEIDAAEPALLSCPARFTGPVYHPSEKTGEAVQAAIDEAAAAHPDEPSVVFLTPGEYSVNATIVVPPNVPVRIMGDFSFFSFAGSARLIWDGTTDGPVFRLDGPSKASVGDLYIHGANRAQGLLIDNADQPGGRVFMHQANSGQVTETGTYGVLVDGLDWTRVESWDHRITSDNGVSVKVIGGAATAAGQATTSCMNIWGTNVMQFGSGPEYGPFFDVAEGGRLLETDNWGECGSGRIPYIKLTNASSGEMTIEGYKIQYHSNGMSSTIPTMIFDGFGGKAIVLGLDMANSIVEFAGDNAQQNVLFAGVNFSHNNAQVDSTKSTFTNTATQGQNVIMECSYDMLNNASCSDPNNTACYSHMGADSISTVGGPTDEWVRDMMAQARANHPTTSLDPTPAGATDVKLWRLSFGNCVGALLRIKADPAQTVKVPAMSRRRGTAVSYTRTLSFAGKPDIPRSARTINLFDSQGKMVAALSVGKNENPSLVAARAIAASAKNILLVKAW